MESELYNKTPPSKAAAMEMRRMSLIRPLPSADAHRTSQKSFEPATFKNKMSEILNGLPYNICITILTFYVLFADDFRQVFFPPKADLPFSIIVIICMTIYLIEIFLNIYTKTDYFLSFFFWLDVISTGTMVFDLMWINVGGSAGVATNIVQIARAGKASRIGARSARMIRIVKLIKMVQQYKTAKQEITSQQGKQVEGLLDNIQKKGQDVERPERRRGLAVIDPLSLEKAALDSPDNIHQEMMKRAVDRKSTKQVKLQSYSQIVDLKQTRVGITLKESMETNTTMMIMLVLLSVPLLNSSTWFAETTIYEDSINQLDFFMVSQTDSYTTDFQLGVFINQSLSLRNPLVYLDYPVNQTCCNFPRDFPEYSSGVPNLQDLRASSTSTYQMGNITIVYDTTGTDIFSSQLNIGRTLFVCILLIFSSLLFSQDVQDYLLEPLESMLVTVRRISADPLKAIIALQNQKLIKETIKTEVKHEEFQNQPAILENMIVKIGSLLVVGFGEAGSEIIAKNIEAHGAINPVLSGTKMIAIFGFCDIRNFTDATEVLQTGVMSFVNDVAEIVHGIVNKCGGSANKNIGDAFLLVWKFKQKEVFLSDSNGKTEVTLRKIKKVSQMADLAVYSFMKIVAELSKATKLLKYTNNKALQDRIKNFTGVKMGFGMHVGWAIEGAIGSSFKIDASYLSPNVNMASRLQAATKQFGVLTLFSGQLVQLMTPYNQKLLRLIDRVTVKGSIEPIDFYTLDIDPSVLKEIKQEKSTIEVSNSKQNSISVMQKKKQKMLAYKTRQTILSNIQSGKNVTERIFTNDRDFQSMREAYTQQFFIEWSKGYNLYIKGSWNEAKLIFQNTLRINDSLIDGPSNTLLQVLASHENQAPTTWQGFRQLTQK